MKDFLRSCGIALVLGAALLIIINVFLLPSYLASFEKGEAVARTSEIYMIRISAALIDALLLLFGSIGLYLSQKNATGKFGAIAFGVAFIGNSLLIAIEWSNLFVLRAVAQTSPEILSLLDQSSLMTAGFVSGVGFFTLGWLLLSVSIWRVRITPRWAAPATLAGLFLIPILGVTPLGVYGQVVGNVVFGFGLIGMGYSLIKTE
jgi:hypothetical protein